MKKFEKTLKKEIIKNNSYNKKLKAEKQKLLNEKFTASRLTA